MIDMLSEAKSSNTGLPGVAGNGMVGVYPAEGGNPVIGRFLSPDPIIQSPDFTQSYNSYSYCFNNPLIYIDPSGYDCKKIKIEPGTLLYALYQLWGKIRDAFANAGSDGPNEDYEKATSMAEYDYEAANIIQFEGVRVSVGVSSGSYGPSPGLKINNQKPQNPQDVKYYEKQLYPPNSVNFLEINGLTLSFAKIQYLSEKFTRMEFQFQYSGRGFNNANWVQTVIATDKYSKGRTVPYFDPGPYSKWYYTDKELKEMRTVNYLEFYDAPGANFDTYWYATLTLETNNFRYFTLFYGYRIVNGKFEFTPFIRIFPCM